MESSWLVGARILDPVADFDPDNANELWVVSHEYLLNGKPFTLVVGIVGRTRVHLERVLPLAGQVEQTRPSSQLLLLQVSPIVRQAEWWKKKETAI